MNSDKLQRLEKNKKFRKKFYNKEVWKNYAIIPPSVILFASLFGILYLFNLDRLVSLYTIPCLILLVLGTIWLKAARRYILTQSISDDKTFLICPIISLMNKEGKTIRMFSVGNNRHNKNYLEKKKKEILDSISGDFSALDLTSKAGLQLIPNTDVYIVTPSFSDRIANKNAKMSVNTYAIFDNSDKIRYINLRELESFS
ncbi:hypothetical protein CLV62_11486 [Dysgonomonas alginatilytica]|uniref:Uncharacterized protein n=1 Tax=Dysgonomonas alginatilytica TaxID=1605892 RepID=A0A2V3PPZ1_9BACT|nr:hypothetical protein [Dysgonomonas alginatilytica]PXV63369.1 hypothetical protein CLV62_11486 [Dysgonomonas alginatilytica]